MIDCHAHLAVEDFDVDRSTVRERAAAAGHYTVDLLLAAGARWVLTHAFDGKASHAVRAAEAGYLFSVPPSVVRSDQKQKLVRRLPLESLALERLTGTWSGTGPTKRVRQSDLRPRFHRRGPRRFSRAGGRGHDRQCPGVVSAAAFLSRLICERVIVQTPPLIPAERRRCWYTHASVSPSAGWWIPRRTPSRRTALRRGNGYRSASFGTTTSFASLRSTTSPFTWPTSGSDRRVHGSVGGALTVGVSQSGCGCRVPSRMAPLPKWLLGVGKRGVQSDGPGPIDLDKPFLVTNFKVVSMRLREIA
jgi:hypothetical protein